LIAAYVSTFLTALWSAFVPVTPIEPYLIALAAMTGYGPVGLGLTAAVGQTIGKTAIFLGARGVFRSDRVKRWLYAASEHRKRRVGERPDSPLRQRVRALGRPLRAAAAKLTALLERPALTLPILFLSAFAGLPPLLATSIYIAGTRVRTPTFVMVCLIGRAARFIVIACAPQIILG
jgi:membrane protein YqaA with SNARE-associated domain